MLRLFHRSDTAATLVECPLDELARCRSEPGWLWLDASEPTHEELQQVFREFGFDQLALEDVLEPTHFPKIDDYASYLFVVLHGATESDDRLATGELDAFLGEDFLVTIHRHDAISIDYAIEQGERVPAFSLGGPDGMLARIAEGQGRRYLPIIDELDSRIETLEGRSLTGDPDVILDVQALRRDAAVLRRVIGPQREVLLTLSGEYSDLVGQRARQRFSSVYDHHYRMVETLDASRSMLAAVLDTYRSTVAEKMNEVMKVLTVYAAILLPLSLLAGIYGMNFVNIPELDWQYGYFILIAVMAAIAIGQWIYFSRRGFIGGPSLSRLPSLVGRGLVNVALLPVKTVGYLLESESAREDSTREN